jgi:D-glycero-alpha-D-manno-heptose-7-phosphate kinase
MRSITETLEKGPVQASAPCRIDMGGTLDWSTFYLPLHHLDPCTFNAALNLRTIVTLESYEKGKLKISSRGFDDLETASTDAPFDQPLGLMAAIATYFQADGIHIRIDSASPPRSGMGGSSAAAVALTWAFVKAVTKEGEKTPDPGWAARLAHAIEQSVAVVPCGIQDHLAAAFGGVNAWIWPADPTGAGYSQQVLVAPEAVGEFSKHLLIAYCGDPHESLNINRTWVRDFLAGRHRSTWRKIAVLSRSFSHAISKGDYERAKQIMTEETDLRSAMTPDVLDPIGRSLITRARDHGCGARFTGAGGGGCIWALGLPERLRSLKKDWQDILTQHEHAYLLDTAVDSRGIL